MSNPLPEPCPFCGGAASLWMDRRVVCNRCNAEGPDTGDEDVSAESQIAKWNTRHAAAEVAAERVSAAHWQAVAEIALESVASARDCHTCRHYRVMRAECHYQPCVNADRYEALPPVRLWRTT